MLNCMFNTRSLVSFCYLMFDSLNILCLYSLPKACPAAFLGVCVVEGARGRGNSQVKTSLGIWFWDRSLTLSGGPWFPHL